MLVLFPLLSFTKGSIVYVLQKRLPRTSCPDLLICGWGSWDSVLPLWAFSAPLLPALGCWPSVYRVLRASWAFLSSSMSLNRVNQCRFLLTFYSWSMHRWTLPPVSLILSQQAVSLTKAMGLRMNLGRMMRKFTCPKNKQQETWYPKWKCTQKVKYWYLLALLRKTLLLILFKFIYFFIF